MATLPSSSSKLGMLWEVISVRLFRISSILADFLNKLTIQLLLWSPNQQMSLLHMISG
jgi:hypothetical protein